LGGDDADGRGSEWGLTIPLPTPATMKPGIKWVQELLPFSPVMSSKPTPTSRRPGPMSQRMGMRSLNTPAKIDATIEVPLMSSSRIPVAKAE
jgi:hypothetical protein